MQIRPVMCKERSLCCAITETMRRQSFGAIKGRIPSNKKNNPMAATIT